jgi:AraC-like DNA-binding protein
MLTGMTAGGTGTTAVLELRGSGVGRTGRVDLLLATPALVLGEFTCAPDDELWSMDNDIGDLPHIVWPTTTVEIMRAELGVVCADANTVVLYDPGTAYRRRRVTPAGDHCLFFALRHDLLELLPDRLVHADGSRFAAGHRLCTARSWLRKERLVAAARSRCVEPMHLEEMALAAVADLALDRSEPEDRSPRVRDRVEYARVLLGQDLHLSIQVTSVATRLEVSPFHLARQFRACTGRSMYGYRQELRVRAGVRRALGDPQADLSAVAADLGFASHSHFTATCRRVFGSAPSVLRSGDPAIRR